MDAPGTGRGVLAVAAPGSAAPRSAIVNSVSDLTTVTDPDWHLPGLIVTATVKVTGPTGVEMEALTAVSVACLTVYDMLKAADRGMTIDGIRLLLKSGGKSGDFRAATKPGPAP